MNDRKSHWIWLVNIRCTVGTETMEYMILDLIWYLQFIISTVNYIKHKLIKWFKSCIYTEMFRIRCGINAAFDILY